MKRFHFFRSWLPCGFPYKPYMRICKTVYLRTRQDPRWVLLLFYFLWPKDYADQFWHLYHILNNFTPYLDSCNKTTSNF